MKLTWSAKLIKYLLFIFNLLFVISGIIILAVGVSVKAYYYKYESFLDDQYFSLPNLLIATGAIIFFISFFGCCGAIKESWQMLAIFTGLLILIFIFEFSAGIAGYVLRNKTGEYLDKKLHANIANYGKNPEITKMWDVIQWEFECCGVDGPKDYENAFDNRSDNKSLPMSCCPRKNGVIGAYYCNSNEDAIAQIETSTSLSTTVESGEVNGSTPFVYPNSTALPYKQGCKDSFGNFVRDHAVDLGAVGVALCVIQFIGILFSVYLVKQMRSGYFST